MLNSSRPDVVEKSIQELEYQAEGWDGPKPERHHDFIDVIDFPECWKKLDMTVEIEAKAKEPAVLKLKTDLEQHALERGRNKS